MESDEESSSESSSVSLNTGSLPSTGDESSDDDSQDSADSTQEPLQNDPHLETSADFENKLDALLTPDVSTTSNKTKGIITETKNTADKGLGNPQSTGKQAKAQDIKATTRKNATPTTPNATLQKDGPEHTNAQPKPSFAVRAQKGTNSKLKSATSKSTVGKSELPTQGEATHPKQGSGASNVSGTSKAEPTKTDNESVVAHDAPPRNNESRSRPTINDNDDGDDNDSYQEEAFSPVAADHRTASTKDPEDVAKLRETATLYANLVNDHESLMKEVAVLREARRELDSIKPQYQQLLVAQKQWDESRALAAEDDQARILRMRAVHRAHDEHVARLQDKFAADMQHLQSTTDAKINELQTTVQRQQAHIEFLEEKCEQNLFDEKIRLRLNEVKALKEKMAALKVSKGAQGVQDSSASVSSENRDTSKTSSKSRRTVKRSRSKRRVRRPKQATNNLEPVHAGHSPVFFNQYLHESNRTPIELFQAPNSNVDTRERFMHHVQATDRPAQSERPRHANGHRRGNSAGNSSVESWCSVPEVNDAARCDIDEDASPRVAAQPRKHLVKSRGRKSRSTKLPSTSHPSPVKKSSKLKATLHGGKLVFVPNS